MNDREAKTIARAWRKSRIAARLLLRERTGKITARDARLGKILAEDPAVTPRLIQQALHGFRSLRH